MPCRVDNALRPAGCVAEAAMKAAAESSEGEQSRLPRCCRVLTYVLIRDLSRTLKICIHRRVSLVMCASNRTRIVPS